MGRPMRLDALANERDALMAVAGRIRERREALGLDQETLGERAGVSGAYISRIERMMVPNPKIWDLQRVAAALDWTLADLLGERHHEDHTTLRAEVEKLLGPSNAEFVDQFVAQLAALPPRAQADLKRVVEDLIRGQLERLRLERDGAR
jgi:transcriptional regulator with XRE-family HTH domain